MRGVVFFLLTLFVPPLFSPVFGEEIRDTKIEGRTVSTINENIRRLEATKVDKTPAEFYPRELYIPALAAIRGSVTPKKIGQIILNTTTTGQLCISTATNTNAWVRVSTPTLACSN